MSEDRYFPFTPKDAYEERAALLGLLATHYPAWLQYDAAPDINLKDWDLSFEWVLYIILPTGQATWHIANRDLRWFAHLKSFRAPMCEWDGHTTGQKYQRIMALLP